MRGRDIVGLSALVAYAIVITMQYRLVLRSFRIARADLLTVLRRYDRRVRNLERRTEARR